MQRHRFTLLALFATLTLVPTRSNAQAFGINEIGTCAASRGFAVTGSPCADASAIFWNPGYAATQKGWNVLAGAAVILIGGSFTQDTTQTVWEGDVPTAYVPHAFVNYRGDNSRLSYGVGLYAPYGLTSQWTDSFPGRFQALKAALATVYVQPNIGYQINDKWSIGGGPVFGHSTVELIQAIDLSTTPTSAGGPTFGQLGIAEGTEFARANLEGSANSFGAHVGLFGRPSENWTVGVRFLTPLEFEYDDADATFTQTQTDIVLPPGNAICAGNPAACGGNANGSADIDLILSAQFAAGAPLSSQTVATRITHPAQIQGGLGYSGFTNWLLSVDYAWTGWRRFNELPVNFSNPLTPDRVLIEDYNNTSSLRVGAQRMFASGASVRLGFSGVASAAPDETVTPLLPEQDRAYGSLGAAYPITSNLTIEGGYLRVFAPGKRGRIVERSSRNQTAESLNSGVYDLNANVFSFSLKATY